LDVFLTAFAGVSFAHMLDDLYLRRDDINLITDILDNFSEFTTTRALTFLLTGTHYLVLTNWTSAKLRNYKSYWMKMSISIPYIFSRNNFRPCGNLKLLN
jgi:hypothetical protein